MKLREVDEDFCQQTVLRLCETASNATQPRSPNFPHLLVETQTNLGSNAKRKPLHSHPFILLEKESTSGPRCRGPRRDKANGTVSCAQLAPGRSSLLSSPTAVSVVQAGRTFTSMSREREHSSP